MSAGAPPAPDRGAAPRPPDVLDWIAALRPLLWIPAIALFEAGRSSGGGGWWPSPGALPALGSLLSILGAVHLANAWNDRAGDRVNRKGGIVASGSVERRAIAVVAVSCLVVAGALSLAPSVTPGARAWLATALLLGAAYVTPPVELKRRPLLDLVAQAAGYGVAAFALGWAAGGALRAGDVSLAAGLSIGFHAAPYAFGIAAIGVLTMLADREGDEAAGQRTTVVAIGASRAEILATALALAAAAAGLAVGEWAPALWGFLALAHLTLDAPVGTHARARWNRTAIRLQAAFLLLLLPASPVPLLAALALGAAMAAHDRARGGQGYPVSAMAGRFGEAGEAGDATTARR